MLPACWKQAPLRAKSQCWAWKHHVTQVLVSTCSRLLDNSVAVQTWSGDWEGLDEGKLQQTCLAPPQRYFQAGSHSHSWPVSGCTSAFLALVHGHRLPARSQGCLVTEDLHVHQAPLSRSPSQTFFPGWMLWDCALWGASALTASLTLGSQLPAWPRCSLTSGSMCKFCL